MWATAYGHMDLVHVLLECGASVDACDYFGSTALHYAALWGQHDIAEILIRNSADITLKNHSGDTPYDLAQRCPGKYDDGRWIEPLDNDEKATLTNMLALTFPTDCYY